MRPARLEAPETAVGKSGFEAADERTDAATEMRQRREHSEALRDRGQDSRRRPPLPAMRRSRSVIAAAISVSVA
jgi:hypothetical protein